MKMRSMLVFCTFLSVMSLGLFFGVDVNQGGVLPIINDQFVEGQNKCIPPLVEFAFPDGDSGIPASNQQEILPSSDWGLQSTIPGISGDSGFGSLKLSLIRQIDGQDEFWILGRNGKGVFQFRPATRQWKHNQANITLLEHSFLFRDIVNSVWAAKIYESKGVSLLNRYNDKSEQFEAILDQDSFLASKNISKIMALKVDKTGIFWMVLAIKSDDNLSENYFLYGFNPLTRKVEPRILLGQGYGMTIEIGSDGSIFLVDVKNSQLLVYLPNVQEMRKINIPILLEDPPVNLYFDRTGRLWINDRGWFDFLKDSKSPQWYTVIRSPIFINYLIPAGQWGWSRPIFTHDNQGSLLWFESVRGTGWLDPRNGKWCLVTTYESAVLEDSQNHLWMLINGALYKH